MTTTAGPKTKALCVATRCADVDQFIATYHKFCDESSFFVATLNTRPIGLETAFSIQLADNTPVLRGMCTVVDAWATPDNQYNRPGIRLGIKRLTADSVDVFTRLVKAARDAPPDAPPPPLPLAPTTMGPSTAPVLPGAEAASPASGAIKLGSGPTATPSSAGKPGAPSVSAKASESKSAPVEAKPAGSKTSPPVSPPAVPAGSKTSPPAVPAGSKTSPPVAPAGSKTSPPVLPPAVPAGSKTSPPVLPSAMPAGSKTSPPSLPSQAAGASRATPASGTAAATPPELVSLPPRDVPPPSSPTPPVLPLRPGASGTATPSGGVPAGPAKPGSSAPTPRGASASASSGADDAWSDSTLPPRDGVMPSAAGARSTPRPFGVVRPVSGAEPSGSTLALDLPARAPASAAAGAPAAPAPGAAASPQPPVLPRLGRAETPASEAPAASPPADKAGTPPKPASSPAGARGGKDNDPGSTITGHAFRERAPNEGARGPKGAIGPDAGQREAGSGPDAGQAIPELSDLPESLAATARLSRRGQLPGGEFATDLPTGLRNLSDKIEGKAPAGARPATEPAPGTPMGPRLASELAANATAVSTRRPASEPSTSGAAAAGAAAAGAAATGAAAAARPASEPSASGAAAAGAAATGAAAAAVRPASEPPASGAVATARRPGSEPSASTGPGTPRRASSQLTAAEAESRTPGSEFILPANPLSNLTDHQLEGFIDCTLYEDTSNFQEAESSVDIRELLASGARAGASPPVAPPVDDAQPFRSSSGQVIPIDSPWAGQGPVLPFAAPPAMDPTAPPSPPPFARTPPPVVIDTAALQNLPPYAYTPPPMAIDPAAMAMPSYARTPPPMAIDPVSQGMMMQGGDPALAGAPDLGAGYPGGAPYAGAEYPGGAPYGAAAYGGGSPSVPMQVPDMLPPGAEGMQLSGPVAGATTGPVPQFPSQMVPVYLTGAYPADPSPRSKYRGWIVIGISAVVALALLAFAIKLGLSRSRPAKPPPPSSPPTGEVSPVRDPSAPGASEPNRPGPDPSGDARKPASATARAPAPGGNPKPAGGTAGGSPAGAAPASAPPVSAPPADTSLAGALPPGAAPADTAPAAIAASGTPGSGGPGAADAEIAAASGAAAAAAPGSLPVVGSGPCRLNITSTPPGSNVKVDGEKLGVSPMAVDGPCKPRRVEVSHPRYAPVTRVVTPAAGKPEPVEVSMVRPTHSLSIVTSPPGATISIEGRRAGTSPTVVQIMGFNGLKVTLEKPGYKTVTQRFYSKKPKDRLSVRLLQSIGSR